MHDALNQEERLRYLRHLALPEVGEAGQALLKRSSVLVVGAGGLGSPVALYLAAAGVGRIGLVDFDRVDTTNLQRQVLFSTGDVGRRKVEAAAERLRAMNPEIEVLPHAERLSGENALALVRSYDVVVDGADNFTARYLANDAAALLGKPCVHGSILRFEGQVAVFHAGHGPCYRCLYPEPPPPGAIPSCAEAGVLGVLPGVIGTIMAAEVLKLLLGIGETLLGRMIRFDALAMRFREMRVPRDPACPLCGERPTLREVREHSMCCGVPLAKEKMMETITVEELKKAIDAKQPITLIDVRETSEFALCRIPTSTLIPLGELPARLGELDRNADLVIHCKVGGRSAKACEFLATQGFPRVRNLTGGILAWSDRIDPSVPKY